MRKQGLLVLLALGCAATSSQAPEAEVEPSEFEAVKTYDEMGRASHVIDCSDSSNTWDMNPDIETWSTCYQRAGEICQGQGYSVSQRTERPHTYQESWFGLWRTAIKRSLTIRCGPGDDSQPGAPSTRDASYGTCFVVRPDGLVLTAAHVVKGAGSVDVAVSDGRVLPAHVEQVAVATDLALVRIESVELDYLSLAPARSAKTGDDVFTIGYPVTSVLGDEPKFTDGTISALSGIGGEAILLQISVPVHPGNSGGPLVNDAGEVVGVVTSTAAAVPFFRHTGTIPQNIGWAVKSSYAAALFDPPPRLPEAARRAAAIERTKRALCRVMSK